MIRIHLAVLAVLLAVNVLAQPQAPDFSLSDQNGKTTTLAAARGHKVVLVFYRGYW